MAIWRSMRKVGASHALPLSLLWQQNLRVQTKNFVKTRLTNCLFKAWLLVHSHFQRGYNARVDIGRGGFRMVIRALFSCTNWYYHPQTFPLPVTQECKSNLSTALLRQWILTVSDIKRHDLSRWYSTEPTKQSNPHFQFKSFNSLLGQATIKQIYGGLCHCSESATLCRIELDHFLGRSVASTSWTRKLVVAFYVKLIHGCAF